VAPVAVLGPFLAQAAVIDLVLAVVTGLCLFSDRPYAYLANPAFLTKLAFLVLRHVKRAFGSHEPWPVCRHRRRNNRCACVCRRWPPSPYGSVRCSPAAGSASSDSRPKQFQ